MNPGILLIFYSCFKSKFLFLRIKWYILGTSLVKLHFIKIEGIYSLVRKEDGNFNEYF